MSNTRRFLPYAAALLAAAIPAAAQTTRPAAERPKVTIWVCPDNESLGSVRSGECPTGDAELERRKIELPRDPYPLGTCPVSGNALGSMGPPVILMHEGREVRFCCGGCIEKFKANPSSHLSRIDEKIIEQQLPHYPMKACPVSGEPLGAMGEPVNYVHNNRLVRFCCKGCLRGFRRNPGQYLDALDAAVIEQQMSAYPLATCPISGEKLGAMGEPVNIVVANRLVRFCCGGCVGTFYKAPSEHLAKLDKAEKSEP